MTIPITATSAQQASEIYCAKRNASGMGASTFPEGDWQGHRISYNGRVWEAGKDWPEAKAIYNPGGVTPDYWADSTISAEV